MIALAILAVTLPSVSHSKPVVRATETLETIRSFKEFSKLSAQKKELYVSGLQQLVLELERFDLDDKMEYQSADKKRASWNWIETLLPTADASAGDKRCVYAGSMSELDINGRYCLRPRDVSCAPRIQCNPLVFGAGVCTQAGRSATLGCMRSAKPLARIVSELQSKPEEWTAFRDELRGYCASPLPSQTRVCPMIVNRVAQIERVMGESPTISPPAGARVTEAAPRIAPPVPEAVSAAGDAVVTNDRVRVTVSPVRETAAEPAPAAAPVIRAAASCQGSSLLEDLKGPSDSSSTGFNLMTLSEAQSMLCAGTTEPVNPEWLTFKRQMLARRIAAVPTFSSGRNYYLGWFRSVSANFEACVNASRTGQIPDSGISATVNVQGDMATIQTNNGGNLSTHINQQGRTLTLYDVSLCRIRSNAPNVAPMATSLGRSGAGRSAQ